MGEGEAVLLRTRITRGDIDKTSCFDRALSRSHTGNVHGLCALYRKSSFIELSRKLMSSGLDSL